MWSAVTGDICHFVADFDFPDKIGLFCQGCGTCWHYKLAALDDPCLPKTVYLRPGVMHSCGQTVG